MSCLLIYSYTENEYRLMRGTHLDDPNEHIEILYDFAKDELPIAEKVLNKLNQQNQSTSNNSARVKSNHLLVKDVLEEVS